MGNPCVAKMAPFRELIAAVDCPSSGEKSGPLGAAEMVPKWGILSRDFSKILGGHGKSMCLQNDPIFAS